MSKLLNADVKIEDEDEEIILLSILPKSYEMLVTMLLVGKCTLTLNNVSVALLETTTSRSQVIL